MLRNVIFFTFLLSTASLSANTILVVGDSLSSAFGFEQTLGWVQLLEEKIAAYETHDTSWQVVNASIAGETTAGGIARLEGLLDKYQPKVCILALGANDGLRGLALSSMRMNLRAMIESCHHYGQVILLGMQLPPNYGKAYTQAFAAVYASLAEQYNLTFVPFFIKGVTEIAEYMQADNLHPNAAAQPLILQNVWPSVRNFLLAESVKPNPK
jgi:acyl-CoA thioesterase-1